MSTAGRIRGGLPGPPPCLLTSSEPGADPQQVTATADFDTSVIEVAVHGRWSRSLSAETATVIGKCLAEPSAAVITDLHDLGDPDAASVPLWLAARRAATALHPLMPLALCLPTTTALDRRLRQVDAARRLPLFATMAEARAAVARRVLPAPWLHTELLPHPDSVDAARGLVTRAGVTWHLPAPMLVRARLVMCELVGNAVAHASTAIRAAVSWRGTGLHLAVRDGVTHLPYRELLRPPAGTSPGVPQLRGLSFVHATADTWGAVPTLGGKIVWATVRPRRGD